MTDDDRPRSASGTLMRVGAANDRVGRSQPDYYAILAAWDSLGIEMREAFIAYIFKVPWMRARTDGLDGDR